MSNSLSERDYALLSAYVDGELGPTDCRKVEDRIGNCPRMRRQFEIIAGQAVMLRSQSERLLSDTVYPDLSKRIADILDGQSATAPSITNDAPSVAIPKAANSNTRKAIFTGIGAAAAVLLAFVGGSWFSQNIAPNGVMSGTNAQLAEYSPVNNPALDAQISETLENTLSGTIRKVSLHKTDIGKSETLIEPLRTFQQNGLYCREYQVTFPSAATEANAFFGRACRTGSGVWETVYRLIPGAMDMENLSKAPKQKL